MFSTKGEKSEIWAQVGFYASLGFIIPAAVICGYVLGWLLDRWLHTRPILAVFGAFLGGAGGLVEILQLLTRAENSADHNNSIDESKL